MQSNRMRRIVIVILHAVSNWAFQILLLGSLTEFAGIRNYFQFVAIAWGIMIIDFLVAKWILHGEKYRYGAFDAIEDIVFLAGIYAIFQYNLHDPMTLQCVRITVIVSECAMALERLLLTRRTRNDRN